MNMASLFARRHALTWMLGGISAAMLVVIGVETDWGRSWQADVPAAVRAGKGGGDEGVLPAFALPPIDLAFKETAERPLFAWTRRPAPMATSMEAMKKGQYKLTGTSINDTLTTVFLLESATGKTLRANKGAEIPGTHITIATVEPTRVVLKQGDDSEDLKLVTAPSPPRPAAPPAAGAPGQLGAPGQPVPGGPPPGFVPNQPSGNAGQPGRPGITLPGGRVVGVPPVPAEAAAAAPRADAGVTQNPVAPADAAAQRRRRFQNLPQ